MQSIYAQLRSLVLDAISDIIGTYIFEDTGLRTPAIAVDDKGTYPPPNTTVEGLEVVIIPGTGDVFRPLLGGALVENQSKIQLKQWDLNQDTVEATYRLIPVLGGNRLYVGPRVLPNRSIGNIETRTLTFYDSQLYRFCVQRGIQLITTGTLGFGSGIINFYNAQQETDYDTFINNYNLVLISPPLGAGCGIT